MTDAYPNLKRYWALCKASRGTNTSKSYANADGETVEPQLEKDARKNRKIALAFGFVGTGYRGLQIAYENDVKTIERELRRALYLCKAFKDVPEGDGDAALPPPAPKHDLFDDVEKEKAKAYREWADKTDKGMRDIRLEAVNWSRSSRTDAGVHARIMVCAMKALILEEGGTGGDDDEKVEEKEKKNVNEKNPDGDAARSQVLTDAFRSAMNDILEPRGICLFTVQRVPRGFDAKKACSWREYSYVIPKPHAASGYSYLNKQGAEVDVKKLEEALQLFVGSHSYHNFSNLKVKDLSSKVGSNGAGGGKKGKGKGKGGKDNVKNDTKGKKMNWWEEKKAKKKAKRSAQD